MAGHPLKTFEDVKDYLVERMEELEEQTEDFDVQDSIEEVRGVLLRMGFDDEGNESDYYSN